MAIITVSTNITNSTADTDALTLASGDTVNLLPNVGIFNYGAGVSGIHAGGSNSFILNGDVFSMGRDAIFVVAGNNDINIGAASMVLGQPGSDLHRRQQQRDRRRRRRSSARARAMKRSGSQDKTTPSTC